jgi:2'-5' RNA ligase
MQGATPIGRIQVRLFVAIEISDETRATLGPARALIAQTVGGARVPPRVTWVKDAAAHVTLRFVGQVSEETATALCSALRSGFRCAPFDVRWETIGTFPGGRHPRAIWLGATSGAERLDELAALVNQRLDPILGPGELRPFKAHLTIGRVKESGKDVDWTGALAAAKPTPSVTRVDRVTLFQSRLSPKGPTYTALCAAPLVG